MKQFNNIHWKAVSEETYVLPLDPSFNPFKTNEKLFFLKSKDFEFRGGEPHFQIQDKEIYSDSLIITQRFNNVGDIFKVIMAVDAARRMGIKHLRLILPYFPAARQDRVCNEGEPLTVKIFTDLINGCNFDEVVILSPHSEVTPALLNNVTVYDELAYAEVIIDKIVVDDTSFNVNTPPLFNIVCPDAGAGKRVGKIVQHLANKFPQITFELIRCEKVRDVKDGSLKEFHVQATNLNNAHTIIFDDINSMGGTFIGLGKELKKKKAGKVYLFTSHSDCIEGINNVTGFFDHVFTTNSKQDWVVEDTERFTCFEFKI